MQVLESYPAGDPDYGWDREWEEFTCDLVRCEMLSNIMSEEAKTV